MRIVHFSCLLVFLAIFGFISPSFAEETPPKETKRASSLGGQPVNVNVGGAGSLPKGRALTMLNSSFANKNHSEKGGSGKNTFTQIWLLKLRYGVTDRFEIGTVVPWIHHTNSNRGPHDRKYIEGFGDLPLQLTVAPLQQFLGDPLSLSFQGAIIFPTAQTGKAHLPGANAWGGKLTAAIGGMATKDIRLDTQTVWIGSFERGNQQVRRGDQWQWNTNMRYLWDWFDIGLESSFIVQESADKRVAGRGLFNTNNGYKEWFIGPSVNLAHDASSMWLGLGVFFPVMRDYKGPAKSENARFEFKLGKLW